MQERVTKCAFKVTALASCDLPNDTSIIWAGHLTCDAQCYFPALDHGSQILETSDSPFSSLHLKAASAHAASGARKQTGAKPEVAMVGMVRSAGSHWCRSEFNLSRFERTGKGEASATAGLRQTPDLSV